MSSVQNSFPELFPAPKHITVLEGMSDLSTDVRLVTNSVAPLQRKAIRTVLSEVGIRVVANKKKYLVEVCVEPESNFDMSDVPESCRGDYYELKIEGSEIKIVAPGQAGTVLASYTLAALLRRFLSGGALPNVFVRDWPSCPNRGIFIDCAWGMDKMNLADWRKAIDSMAAMKLNVLGIGFYNCTGTARFEGRTRPGEFLMVPIPEAEKHRTEHTLNWYSAEQDFWNKENYLADMVSTEEMVTDIISYASEKAIRVVPFFNSLGHNTYFPRMNKEIAAKDKDGKSTGVGYCTTSAATREFLEKTYGAFLEKYFPQGAEYFDIGLDEVIPDISDANATTKLHSGWCECAECRKHSQKELVADYLVWLAKMLVAKNVKKVVLHAGMLTQQLNLLDKAFVKRLADEGLKDRILVIWHESRADKVDAKNRASNGVKLGLDSWVSPLQSRETWNAYSWNITNIDKVIRAGWKDGATGIISYSVFDPTHFDHQALLSAYCWESPEGHTSTEVVRHWAETRLGEQAGEYLDAVEKLRKIAGNEVYALCPSYKYTCIESDSAWPKEYPGAALEALESRDDAVEALNEVSRLAAEADEQLLKLLDPENVSEANKFFIDSLRSECARVRGYSEAFLYLLGLRAELSSGMVMKRMVTSTIKARDELMDQMSHVEEGKPYHCIPGVMQGMSLLFAFFNQLIYDLKRHAARKQAHLLLWGLSDEKK